MRELNEALGKARGLYEQVYGRPPEELPREAFVPFPPGVDPVRHALAELDHVERIVRQMPAGAVPAGMTGPGSHAGHQTQVSWVPPADAFVEGDDLVFYVEVPGVSREDVQVHLQNGQVIVRGTRKLAAALSRPDRCRPLSQERPWGTFERRFVIPPACRAGQITARCADGVLEVRVQSGTRTPMEETTVDVS